MVRVDAHAHAFVRASSEFPREATEAYPPEREEPAEKLLGKMDGSGIDQAVLVQLGGAQLEYHAYLQHCLRTYPNRFLGIGLIPPDCAEPEDHMDRLAGEGDIIGFQLRTLGGPRDPLAPMDVREFGSYRIWKHAAERDYVLWLFVAAADAHLTGYLIDALPQVRVVFNHLGVCPGEGKRSWDEQGRPRVASPNFYNISHDIYRLSRYENVNVNLSGQYAFSKQSFPYRDLTVEHQKYMVESFSSGRLMWGSDAPWIYQEPGYAALTTLIQELLPDLNEPDLSAIMGGTARRLLRFPPPEGG